jgi:hypothetical protein
LTEDECDGDFSFTCSNNDSNASGDDGNNTGLIAGVLVGAAVLLVGVGVAAVCASKKRKKRMEAILREARSSIELNEYILSNIEVLDPIGAGHYGEVRKGSKQKKKKTRFILKIRCIKEREKLSEEQENGRTRLTWR